MAKARTRNPRYVTDTGTAIFPYLIEPDTKFNPEGDYKVKLRLAPDAAIKDAKGESQGDIQTFIDEMMEKSLETAKAENKGRIKEADAPYEIDEDTGDVLVNFKLKAQGKTRDGKVFTQQPALFDAKGRPTTPEAIWGGSRMKVSFELIPFYTKLIGAGVSLRLKAVQIIELRQGGGGGNAEGFGFGEEEGFEDEGKVSSNEAGFTDEDDDVNDEYLNSGGDF